MANTLTEEQREHAEAAANLVASAMARLHREYGEAAVMEAMRLISTAFASDDRRQAVAQALGQKPSTAEESH